MRTGNLKRLTLIPAATLALTLAASAGTFKHINIDGTFGDWAGVTPAFSRGAPDNSNPVAFKDVYVANDESYLYIRFTLFAPADPFTFLNNIFIDADANTGTGFPAGGARVGSEMLIQSGNGYQEKNGGFNEGVINGLGWAAAPAAPAADFEVRISRSATYATGNGAVFTGDNIAFALEGDGPPQEWAPDIGGISYTFELPPSVLTSNLELLGLTTSSWQVNGAGTDLGTAWLDQFYDDSQPGWSSGTGLFGYTPTPAAYPPINKPLSSGPNTYYFRTHFTWDHSTSNLAFVVTNYLSDGAVYYLNGGEVHRVRMPGGTVSYGTVAAGVASPAGSPDVFGLDEGPLIIGDNILEVETHQAPSSAADMVFGLSLTAAAQYPVRIVDPTLPNDRTVIGGDSTTFNAIVLGSGPLSYQWLRNGTNVPDATNATYTIASVLPGDAGTYALQVINPLSTNTTRAAVLTVSNTPIVFTDPSQPADQTVIEGHSATFSVAASGSAPLQYQWFKGSSLLQGETNAVFSIPFAVQGDAGTYHAQVSNPAGVTNSRNAVLTVQVDSSVPALSAVSGSPQTVSVTFSKPVDSASASNPNSYKLNNGASVLSAVPNPNNNTQVTLTTSGQTRGTVYTLTVNGVQDLFGHTVTPNSQKAFLSTIQIDGSFADWEGITALYTNDVGSTTATDWKEVYVYNDADYIYFRVTLWEPSDILDFHNNIFIDTDNNPTTGYAFFGGTELLIESGIGYQEKNGGFSGEGGINDLGWLSAPTGASTNFEFRVSRAATYESDHLPVFTTNVINFALDGENSSFTTVNRMPPGNGITIPYTLVEPSPLPPGPLSIALSGGQVRVSWSGPGVLQSRDSLTAGTWSNVPGATSPYTAPANGPQKFFRLAE